jgi:hypothetical protein
VAVGVFVAAAGASVAVLLGATRVAVGDGMVVGDPVAVTVARVGVRVAVGVLEGDRGGEGDGETDADGDGDGEGDGV